MQADVLRHALGLGLAIAWAGCSPSPAPPLPDILLISIDALRADHLPTYGYARDTAPNLSRYLAEAVVYENAYSAASYTSGSVVSMLSGLYPSAHGVRSFYRKLSPVVEILPDHLRTLGYQTAAIVSNTVLTDEALGIASRFDHFDDFVDERELNRVVYERRASRTTDAALRWIALDRDPDRPHFLWIHYMDPHAPYNPPTDATLTRFEHEGQKPLALKPNLYQTLPGVSDGLTYVDRYDEEIAYTDREIGRLFGAYDRQDLLAGAIVILTADHGEVLLERRPYFKHSPHILNVVLRVPLLVRWPGGHNERVTTPISLVDLVPTLLGALGAPIPVSLEGVPFDARRNDDLLLLETLPREPGRPPEHDQGGEGSAHRTARLRSAIRGEEKWTFRADSEGRLERRAFFDLGADPQEDAPRRWRRGHRDVERLLEETLASEIRDRDIARESREGSQLTGPKKAPALEPHQEEALRALGYIQ